MSEPYYPEGGATVEGNGGKKTASAKEISKWSLFVATLWIGGLHLLKVFWAFISEKPFGMDSTEIIFSGLALAAVWSPVFFSIMLDKIGEIRLGKPQ